MFGIGLGELIVILAIAMIVVGPERMPELARRAGSAIRDLRRMYDNLRAELGPDYDEVERAIRTLRSLDPRRELDTYGRKFLEDLAKEAGPEAESLLHSSPAQLSESLKQSFVKSTTGTVPAALESTTVAASDSTETVTPAVAEGSYARPAAEELPASSRPARSRVSRIYAISESDHHPKPHTPNPIVARLGHDLLSDNMLDQPLKEAFAEPSSNGHEPA